MNTAEGQIEIEIEALLKKMTCEEKVGLCHASSKFATAGVTHMDIEPLTMSDGPHGVRGEVAKDSWDALNLPIDLCTYLPTETALAATWNPNLSTKFGEVLGSEARYRGKDIILGPGVNIIRTPLCGRNFEYMSEDPYLIEKMAPNLVKGIQSQDTAACVKHYCLNNQELDRNRVNIEVSERALHEIYLKGFYSAIVEGNSYSVMGAYNRFLNQHCCHNEYLVNQILKGKWGFDGVYLSDWAGTHDTEESIFNGLDIEMGTNKPYNEYYLADAFIEKAKQSPEAQKCLDDKVRRILRLMMRIKKHSADRSSGEYNTREHQEISAQIAQEAMVLLKNENNLLPLSDMNRKKLLVVGTNAVTKHAEGGQSSGIRALYEITPLEGIKNYLAEHTYNCDVEYVSDIFDLKHHVIPTPNLHILDTNAGCRACIIDAITVCDKKQTVERTYAESLNILGGKANQYQMLLCATVPESGAYSLLFSGDCRGRYTINDSISSAFYFADNTSSQNNVVVLLDAGETLKVEVTVERNCVPNQDKIEFSFGWITPLEYQNSSNRQTILDKAADADYVIYCAGLDHSYDTESFDRSDMHLPIAQEVLIPEILKVNPNTVITITAGSPVEMPWIDDTNAVLWTWYAGMEGGNVLAKILFGEISPSGKMPFTLPKRYEDHPAARYGEHKVGNCKYNEDIFVGYRGFDKDGIEPMFAFGHGMTYSEFEYSNLSIKAGADFATVSFDVTNIGTNDATEIAQMYVGDVACTVPRAVRELCGFEKSEIKAGHTKHMTMEISKKNLSFYDENIGDFVCEQGEFVVEVGSSSRDIRLRGSFVL